MRTEEAELDLAAAVEAEFDLEPHHRAVLEAAVQAHARWKEIQESIDRHGVLVEGRYSSAPRANPLLAQEARAREAFVRILRDLRLGAD